MVIIFQIGACLITVTAVSGVWGSNLRDFCRFHPSNLGNTSCLSHFSPPLLDPGNCFAKCPSKASTRHIQKLHGSPLSLLIAPVISQGGLGRFVSGKLLDTQHICPIVQHVRYKRAPQVMGRHVR